MIINGHRKESQSIISKGPVKMPLQLRICLVNMDQIGLLCTLLNK